MPKMPLRGLLPSLSTTKIATPAIINCVYKEIKQHITIFKKKENKRTNKISPESFTLRNPRSTETRLASDAAENPALCQEQQ
jgi:hypothetical protein